jgi:hypothetical protein
MTTLRCPTSVVLVDVTGGTDVRIEVIAAQNRACGLAIRLGKEHVRR